MGDSTEANILWNFHIQMNRQVLASQPDIMIVDEEQKTVVMINVAVPNDSKIMREYENLENIRH